ncbi:MAG: tRNA (adenosine(37)-N6)-dimethylallyltransferase MiaA [Planktomarina sp.]|nr:tRNA (adenosine(37)-N6)-dimethylallyltransferase MiaA [Planktomarina sp.]MDC3385553.1 tRNA (adenosine(37)-N6)-dimethylallyltransferase MiaA [Planktomarina sp.]
MQAEELILSLNETRPILIAGATASGKSALAIKIATKLGGVIINADAMQVYEGWQILTARPTKQDQQNVSHLLYGHVDNKEAYSVGDWLRQVTPLIDGNHRPIIVGGTGLYFRALTEGLANIPKIPEEYKQKSSELIQNGRMLDMIADFDEATRSKIDLQNPVRVARAWEVLQATGKSIVSWQADTPPPILNINKCDAILMHSSTHWLNERIKTRFYAMIDSGVLKEITKNSQNWDPQLQSSQAIGATELIEYNSGRISIEKATELAIIASRQYAKRQRTWFRKRMANWRTIAAEGN